MLYIGKLASATGVGIETIRYYERQGLLPKPDRTSSGYRIYSDESMQRLKFIRVAKKLGFSLEEIKGLLNIWDNDSDYDKAREMCSAKLETVEKKLAEMQRLKEVLHILVTKCEFGAHIFHHCPLIKMLDGEESPEDIKSLS